MNNENNQQKLSSIADFIIEYFHERGEKLQVYQSIEDNNLRAVLEKIFQERSLSYDLECVDSVSVYESLLLEHASITSGEWSVSDIEILGPDESDICDYDEVVLKFNSFNSSNEWLISGVDSDYVNESFYQNLEDFTGRYLRGEFKVIPTFDQCISFLYLSKSLSKIFDMLLKSRGLVRELCATGQSDYLIWLYGNIGESGTDVCSHFGFEYQIIKGQSYDADSEKEKEINEDTNESDSLNLKLIESIKAGDISAVKRAIENGADVNFDDPPPLLTAAEENNLEIVKLLLKLGADANQSEFSFSALSEAAMRQANISMVKALIQAGANPNTYHHQGSVLSHTCYHNKLENGEWKAYPIDDKRYEVAGFLLDSGASANGARGDTPGCPLESPIVANDFRTVQLLIDYNAKLNVMPVLTTANWCAYEGRYEMLKLLLKNGFKPNPRKAKDKLHASPLHYAIANGHQNIVELLLEHKINVNYVPNYSKQTHLLQHLFYESHPLVVAIENRRIEIMRMLLENGSNPNGAANIDNFYLPPMLAAIGEKFNVEESIEYIELLLDAGADINIKKFDASPVTWAIREGYKELADFLKSKGGKEKF